ncbi:FMN-binding protein [Aliiglaciecola sp. CAU 1673]|uniref:FMN-binding protein n=1 Tax=Aliiglaciecola sp. CAU 1673 TaxID=3032595 RepID=UPI0023DAED8E|nr:FMN-binding protein [Aliiglaciecola sp. CAU 1673]MDF2178864.1 FMN-binding protein [Aliiglaciecola sp. CAU 1673]
MKAFGYGLILLLGIFDAVAEQIYQSPDDFIRQALGQSVKPDVIWLDDRIKQDVESILAHPFNKLRLRYWQKEQDTVWILEEIGKEAPITVGIHVANGKIANTQVLIYRESRGDEVRHRFFTDQFLDATLDNNLQLDRHIDGITGATLSVRALTKISRIALYLHNKVQQEQQGS